MGDTPGGGSRGRSPLSSPPSKRIEDPASLPGGRSSAVERRVGAPSGETEPDPEVPERARRRQFTAEYKERIVREADACRASGEIGALLRREGLYSSNLVAWRRQLREHGVQGLARKKRGPATKERPSAREQQLEREKKALEKKLAKAELIIEFQKKVHALLGIPLKSHELDEDDS
jgi:transposase-like protein